MDRLGILNEQYQRGLQEVHAQFPDVMPPMPMTFGPAAPGMGHPPPAVSSGYGIDVKKHG